MQQKKIWTLFLIIGISVLDHSCQKHVDAVKTITYVYRNSSGHDLNMEVYNSNDDLFKNYYIPNNSSIETHTSRLETVALFFFASLEDHIGDSVVLRFTEGKCIHYLKDNTDKIFHITQYDNYDPILMEYGKPITYTLYYTITFDDYNESVDCEVST